MNLFAVMKADFPVDKGGPDIDIWNAWSRIIPLLDPKKIIPIYVQFYNKHLVPLNQKSG